jgi:hypothetical protein
MVVEPLDGQEFSKGYHTCRVVSRHVITDEDVVRTVHHPGGAALGEKTFAEWWSGPQADIDAPTLPKSYYDRLFACVVD